MMLKSDHSIAGKIILGTANFGSKISVNEGIKIIEHAYLLGINKIDTADSYANAESIIGEAIYSMRNMFQLATKVGNPTKLGSGLNPTHIRRSLEESLNRLRTDFIDIYYVHNFDYSTDLHSTLLELDRLYGQYHFKKLGCSNFNLHQLIKSNCVLNEFSNLRFTYCQPVFNILEYSYIYDFLKYTKGNNIISCGYSPLAGGVLSGKYINGIQNGSRAEEYDGADPKTAGFIPKINWLSNRIARKIQEIASTYNLTAAQLSLGWALRNELIDHVIIGVSSLDSFKSFVDVDVPLEAIDEVVFSLGLRRS